MATPKTPPTKKTENNFQIIKITTPEIAIENGKNTSWTISNELFSAGCFEDYQANNIETYILILNTTPKIKYLFLKKYGQIIDTQSIDGMTADPIELKNLLKDNNCDIEQVYNQLS